MKNYSISGIVVAIAMAVLPFVVSSNLFSGSINAKYFFILTLVSVSALYYSYLLLTKKHSLSTRGRWLLYLMGAVLGVHYIASFSGVYHLGSLFSDILRSTGVIFLTYIAFLSFYLSELLHEKDWTLLRRAVALSSTLFAFLSFFSAQGFGAVGHFLTINFRTNGLSLGNTTFAGAFLLLGFIITLIELVRSDSVKKRYAFVAFGLVQLFSPYLLNFEIWTGGVSLANPVGLLGEARASSASALLLIVFLAGVWALQKYVPKPIHNRFALVWAGAWLVGIASMIALLFIPSSFVQEKYIESSTPARIFIWEGSAKAIQEHPFLGWGPENFRLAYDGYIDSRLYLDENIGEVWFDRAHNIIIDTLVSVGFIGGLALIIFAIYFVRVVQRAYRNKRIGYGEATILGAFVVAHFLQLQTSFDTVVTYTLVGVLVGYVLWLELGMVRTNEDKETNLVVQKGVAVLLIVAVLSGAWYALIAEYNRQKALFELFVATSQDQQIELIDRALTGSASFEALRLSSSSMIKGVFERPASSGPAPNIPNVLAQLSAYERHYDVFLERVPDDYRLRMDYAYLLLVKTVLGENRIEDAKRVIEDSYRLSPGNPLTYVLAALSELYGGNIELAKEKAREAIEQNPDVHFSQNVLSYIQEQERQFPVIRLLKMENL